MTDSPATADLLQTAAAAARAAGAVIRKDFGHARNIRHKNGPRDLVTDTDKAAQQAALAIITARHPDHDILAEEDPSTRPDADGVWTIPPGPIWIVDPLDGTTNFTTAIPFICSSVGVAIDGEPVAGAIYDPLRDEMFLGGRGVAATLNGEPIAPMQALPLAEMTISVDWGHADHMRRMLTGAATDLAGACRTLRAMGSAALALAYVAAGPLHAYINLGLQPWDTAGGAAIIRAAGGDLLQADGSPWQLGRPGTVAAHPSILPELVALLGNH